MRRLTNVEVQAVYPEVLAELVAHLVLPLPNDPRRTHDQHAPGVAPTLHRSEQQSHLNGLSKTHVIRDQPVRVVGCHDAMDQVDLVRQRVDIQSVQRARNLVP